MKNISRFLHNVFLFGCVRSFLRKIRKKRLENLRDMEIINDDSSGKTRFDPYFDIEDLNIIEDFAGMSSNSIIEGPWDYILNSISNMAVIYDSKYNVVKYNKRFKKFLNLPDYNQRFNIYTKFNKNLEFPNSSSCVINFDGKKIDFYKLYCYVYEKKDVYWIHDMPLKNNHGKVLFILRMYTKVRRLNQQCENCLSKRGCVSFR